MSEEVRLARSEGVFMCYMYMHMCMRVNMFVHAVHVHVCGRTCAWTYMYIV